MHHLSIIHAADSDQGHSGIASTSDGDRVTRFAENLISTRTIDPGDVPFDIGLAYKFLKIRKSAANKDDFDEMIRKSLVECRKVIAPVYRFAVARIESIDKKKACVALDREICFEGAGLVRVLRDAKQVAFFVLTLGAKFDELVEEWTVEDFTLAYVLDGVASACLHGVLHILEKELSELADENGLVLSKRFSPGFHRWDLRQQKQLFELLDPGKIGMELSDSFVMLPQHSLSGIYSMKVASSAPTLSADNPQQTVTR